MNTEKINTNPAFENSQEMQQICRGIFHRLGLNAFSFSRIYQDGSRAELWTDPYALEHSFFLKQHISQVYTPDLFNNQKFVFYDLAIEEFPTDTRLKIANQLKDQKELFNHANCVFVINYYEHYTEYFAFYTLIECNNALNSYVNNKDKLVNFIKYFRRRGKLIISAADDNRLIKPWIDAKPDLTSMPANIIHKNKAIELTQREQEVADLICEGLTAKEAADILYVSFKTIEKHTENIKHKLGFSKKSKLINYLLLHSHEKR